jgi:hypothetical protein
LTAVAWAFSLIYLVVNFIIVPAIGARVIGTTYAQYVAPLSRPFLAALLSAPIPLAIVWSFERLNVVWFIVAVVAYGAAYAVFSWTQQG